MLRWPSWRWSAVMPPALRHHTGYVVTKEGRHALAVLGPECAHGDLADARRLDFTGAGWLDRARSEPPTWR